MSMAIFLIHGLGPPQTVPTIQRVYRDQTVNDAIQSAVDDKFDPPFRL